MFLDRAVQLGIFCRKVQRPGGAFHRVSATMSRAQPIPTSARHDASKLAVVTAFTTICLIWGSTYLAIRYAVETLPPLLMMGVRHLTAGGLLYAWTRARGTAAPLRVHWKSAAITGAFLFLG